MPVPADPESRSRRPLAGGQEPDVSDEGEVALAAVHRLPEQAVAGLRGAFATEVAERLPRLHAALAAGRPEDALRDAHTLGSSALVVGEPALGRAARAAEAALLAGESATERLAELVRLLDRWAP